MYVTIFSVLTLLTATLRPYKVNRYNLVDLVIWLFSVIVVTWYSYLKEKGAHWSGSIYVVGSFPFLYILCDICLAGVSFIIKETITKC